MLDRGNETGVLTISDHQQPCQRFVLRLSTEGCSYTQQKPPSSFICLHMTTQCLGCSECVRVAATTRFRCAHLHIKAQSPTCSPFFRTPLLAIALKQAKRFCDHRVEALKSVDSFLEQSSESRRWTVQEPVRSTGRSPAVVKPNN